MITYKAMYKFLDDDWVHGEVLDFPGVLTADRGLDKTREMLALALAEMAEYVLDQGEALPQPDAGATHTDADIEEPIYLLLEAANQVSIVPRRVVA